MHMHTHFPHIMAGTALGRGVVVPCRFPCRSMFVGLRVLWSAVSPTMCVSDACLDPPGSRGFVETCSAHGRTGVWDVVARHFLTISHNYALTLASTQQPHTLTVGETRASARERSDGAVVSTRMQGSDESQCKSRTACARPTGVAPW